MVVVRDDRYLRVHEVIERIEMLLDKSFDFEKGWDEFPFILFDGDQRLMDERSHLSTSIDFTGAAN